MSHWVKLKMDVLKDVKSNCLDKSLKEIGFGLDRNVHEIENAWGKEQCDAALTIDGKVTSLGLNFKQVDGKTTVEVCGDFYMTGFNQQSFMEKLSQYYQKNYIIDTCANQGWVLDESGVTEVNGSLKFKVYNYA